MSCLATIEMSSFRDAMMSLFTGGHDGRRGHDHVVRQGEMRRLHIIHKVLEGAIKQVEASEILSLSCRQIRRVVKRIKIEGNHLISSKII